MLSGREVQEQFKKEVADFLADLEHENELQAILRGHLYIENELVKLLKGVLVEPTYVLSNNFGFMNKLSLAVGLGLITKDAFDVYRRFNTIRNNYAHKLSYKVTEADLNSIKQLIRGEIERDFNLWIFEQSSIYANEKDVLIQLRIVIAFLWSYIGILVYEKEMKKHRTYLIGIFKELNLLVAECKKEGNMSQEVKSRGLELLKIFDGIYSSDYDQLIPELGVIKEFFNR
ncbi:hypothetical protein [Peribacillus sp. V2I11]|uniref:hypothetical protein n=1 Tax=Peribacillus sp. V2I11 TaxID=3042277 RepID=UPI002787E935|nr:hypothetical protein [Peribacillus sp. V2I11]MDQ0884839.1 hypothetical protein [Peribacillus sp. V2I11]